ncbi:hypothetical protein Kpol_322p6 [Vanderwaltozyma polyspora DSM 70294]|uniref:WSC domain-containing protein n=1 Tax=Vanderwaltozyma polyspora (strain ATCC 22028 / DSM 70294 / BCRC 21397 / CBS 2163 / NBRC 10782 / NRRL Y-8283 / UCD 57-17) TaxID=436907 RepID=A7TSY0_VANPO|nr:uncharacterized protein Kpol_322p6 [Vanderwaltozyma polyspora DSM 70294]EDO14629.1 hypothetical protein Kpol_322p6 [Vanderwaltozyma polyspora DSM 70294]
MIPFVSLLLLVIPHLSSIVLAADGYTLLNCYGSLPSGFTFSNQNVYQSSQYCYDQCSNSGYSYFALFNHGSCYCGNTDPSSLSTSSSCDAYCNGYKQEMCGGTSAYSIYRIGNGNSNNNAQSSSSSTNSGRNAGTSSSTSSSTSTTSNNLVGVGNVAGSSSSSPSSASTSQTTTLFPASSLSGDGSSGDSASTGDETTANENTSATDGNNEVTSVIYSTAYHTEGGSTIYITNTITQVENTSSATASSGSDSDPNSASTSGNNSKKTNVGAIVGGVVGGVGGAIAVTVIVLLIIRNINKRREEERMEKEYQEAIKPVEYSNNSVFSKNTDDHNNNNNNSDFYSSSVSSHRNLQVDGDANANTSEDPFDDSRRISIGSVFETGKGNKVLTVVNPDEEG